MANDKNTKGYRVVVIGVLVVSLILNVVLLSRTTKMEAQVNQVIDMQHNLISNVDGQSVHIQGMLEDMKEQQSWITPITLDIISAKENDRQFSFEWQVKELQKNSEILFHYKLDSQEDYTSIPVKEVEQGFFQANVSIEVPLKPEWHHTVTTQDEDAKYDQGIKEILEENYQDNELMYYVSVSSNDLVKSGEVQSEHLGDFGSEQYGIIQSETHLYEDNYNFLLVNHNEENPSNEIEEVYLLKYENETLLEEQMLTFDSGTNSFKLVQQKQYEDMRLVARVVYQDGKVFEREVY
ncbi:hypothetical protein [Ornithinibacillus xuwenensis]|uniref:Uncharacterized protein n=1 Tax=Ornithinibacillus xuwenensis TaxID=3144668 RepID=A0ABU9XI02_9BACI